MPAQAQRMKAALQKLHADLAVIRAQHTGHRFRPDMGPAGCPQQSIQRPICR